MAVTITTPAGTTTPTPYPSQNRYAQCANGVRWLAITRPGSTRIEFWTDASGTWAELTDRRIPNIDPAGGVDMKIERRADGQERLAVTFIRAQRVQLALGKFTTAARSVFVWQASSVFLSRSGGGTSAFWRAPAIALVPIGSRWLVPAVWSRNVEGRTRIHYQRWVFTDVDEGHGQGGGDAVIHDRDSSVQAYPSLEVRHAGGNVNTTAPDLYVSWATGVGSSEEGGTPDDNLPRQYLMRMPYVGLNWTRGNVRILREAGVARSPGSPTKIAAIYTGEAFARVAAPSGNAQDTLQLHLMDPQDSRREKIDVPELGKGAITNVDITYDPNGDIYIVACGTSNGRLAMIRYVWATRQWGTWADVGAAENAEPDSLSLKRGVSGKQIQGIYAIVSGANRAVRHETFGTVNTLPKAAGWLVDSGARSTAAGLTIGPWAHDDPDGDAQAQYQLERTVRSTGGTLGAPEYWNGVSWQSTPVAVSSAASSLSRPSGWGTPGEVHSFRVRTADAEGFGPWSPAFVVVASTAVNPTIVTPANGANVTTARITVTWDVAEQGAYLVELKTGDGATVLWPTGGGQPVGDGGVRSVEIPVDLDDGGAYDVEVTTWNLQGLRSTTAKHDITVSLVPTPVPTGTWAAVPGEGAIDLTIVNGTPGAGEAAAARNDVYQVVGGVRTLVGQGVAPDSVFRDRFLRSWLESDPTAGEVGYVIRAYTDAGAFRESAEVT